jgi:hypothetical protein
MKINKKALELIEKGLSSGTVLKLTESQINDLHSKLVSEVTMVSKNDTSTIDKLKNEKKPFEVYEKEMKEDQEDSMDFEKGSRSQDPQQVGPSSNDGFDNYGDGTGEFNESKTKSNAYSICHSQVGPKKSRKWQRCVKQVEKQLKEGKNPVSLFIENKIMELVSKHIPAKMTKGDLLRHINEDGPAVAPSKPKTSPGTKPGKPGTRPQRPAHPLKNPNPGEKPAPKAKKSHEDAKNEVLDLILQILKK